MPVAWSIPACRRSPSRTRRHRTSPVRLTRRQSSGSRTSILPRYHRTPRRTQVFPPASSAWRRQQTTAAPRRSAMRIPCMARRPATARISGYWSGHGLRPMPAGWSTPVCRRSPLPIPPTRTSPARATRRYSASRRYPPATRLMPRQQITAAYPTSPAPRARSRAASAVAA